MELRIHYDFGSPYAYLAWQRVHRHAERYARANITWVPVSAAHLFKMDGTAPNMLMPNQAKYLIEDVRRCAAELGVPFNPPPAGKPGAMPVRSIEAMRMQFMADSLGKGDAWRAAVYLAYFQDGHDISNAEVLEDLANQVGLPAGAEAATDPGFKQALIETTGAAYAAGAPGVPFSVLIDADNIEHYWGQDRLSFVEQRLGPLPGSLARATRG